MKAFKLMSLFFLLVLYHIPIHAQNIKITGNVSFENDTVDNYYNLLVYELEQDTLYLNGSGFFGKQFTIEAPSRKKLLIKITSLGYKPYEFIIDKQPYISQIDIGDVFVEEESFSLDVITIVAKRPQVKMKDNKLTIHLKNTVLSDAGDLLQLLLMTPGIIQGGEDKLIVPGRGEPLIIVDGKEIKNMEMLKSFRSADIEKIEIDRSPSSLYSASVKSVIRIKTIDRLKDNLYLQVSNNLSHNRKFSNTPSLQFKIKKDRYSSMLTYNYQNMNNLINETYFKYITLSDYVFTNISENKLRSNFQAHRLLWTGEIDITDKSRIGLRYMYQDINRDSKVYNQNQTDDGLNYTKKIIQQNQKRESDLHSISLDYYLEMKDHSTLSFITDYAFYKSNTFGKTKERNILMNSTSDIDIYNYSKYNVYTALLKYDLKIVDNWNLQAGSQFSDVNNPSRSYNDGEYLENLNNKSSLTDRIIAGYLNTRKDFGNLSVEMGVRYEYAESGIKSFTDKNEIVRRYYSDFFPTIGVNYDMYDDLSFSLNYSRYIDRPGFNELNPGVYYEDSLSYVSGNPYVKPSYNNEITLTGGWKNTSLSITYSVEKDARIQTTLSDENNSEMTYMIPINLENSSRYLGFNIMHTLNWEKLNLYSSLGMNLPYQEVPYLDSVKKMNKISWNFSFNTEYNINKKYALYANFFYNSPRESLITYQYSINSLNVGARGKFLSGNLIVNLYGTDLLGGSNYNHLYGEYLNIKSGTNGKGDFRGVRVGLSYILFNSNRVSIKSRGGNSSVLERT